ncbi:TRAP transporter substrate-binding protein [Leptospira interrogans]
MMSITRRHAVAAFASALALMTTGAQAQDKQITIRFPFEYAADVAPGLANQAFKKLVEERSNGRIKVQLYPNGSLLKGLDLLQGVVRGDAEMTTLVSAYWVGVSPKLSVFDLPYAFPTHEAFYKAMDDSAFQKDVFGELESKGITVLGMLPYDYVVPGSRKGPLIKAEDLKALKLRAVGKTNAAALTAAGATAVSINITEVSTAIQQGVIDGLNTPLDAFVSYRFFEPIKNVTYARYFFAFYPWTVNAKFWAGLSDADRSLLEKAAGEVLVGQRKIARDAADQAKATLISNGVKVHEQTAEEAKAWGEAMGSTWATAESQFGKPLIDRIRAFSR